MSVGENLVQLKRSVPGQVTLVAVSKTKPDELVLDAYQSGHRDFGENKAQDLVARHERLPADIRWHMVGHLQTNKVKYLAPFVYLIHGVDSLKLLKVIQKEGVKCGRVLDCLLQVRIAREETKYGLVPEEVLQLVDTDEFQQLEYVRIRGVMGMATFTENREQIREEFRLLKRIFDELKAARFTEATWFDQLSMGMSGDYRIALEEGSTMVRIGSLIFGPRNL